MGVSAEQVRDAGTAEQDRAARSDLVASHAGVGGKLGELAVLLHT